MPTGGAKSEMPSFQFTESGIESVASSLLGIWGDHKAQPFRGLALPALLVARWSLRPPVAGDGSSSRAPSVLASRAGRKVHVMSVFPGSAASGRLDGRGKAEFAQAAGGVCALRACGRGPVCLWAGKCERIACGQAHRPALRAARRRFSGRSQRGHWRRSPGDHRQKWDISIHRAGCRRVHAGGRERATGPRARRGHLCGCGPRGACADGDSV